MQKVLDGLIFIVLCIFLFTGCQKEEDSIHFEEIANATKIEVAHSFSGTVTTEVIEDTDNINKTKFHFPKMKHHQTQKEENVIPLLYLMQKESKSIFIII